MRRAVLPPPPIADPAAVRRLRLEVGRRLDGLVQGGRALALLRGRDYVLPGDIADLAVDVLAHRLVLTYEALADEVSSRSLVEGVLEVVEAPHVMPSQDRDVRAGAA